MNDCEKNIIEVVFSYNIYSIKITTVVGNTFFVYFFSHIETAPSTFDNVITSAERFFVLILIICISHFITYVEQTVIYYSQILKSKNILIYELIHPISRKL